MERNKEVKNEEPRKTREEAEQILEEHANQMRALYGMDILSNPSNRIFYINNIVNGKFDQRESEQSCRLAMENKNEATNIARNFPGKTITPALIYRYDPKVLQNLLYSYVSKSSSAPVGTIDEKMILENIFKSANVDFRWEQIDLARFEHERRKYNDLSRSAENLKNNLKSLGLKEISIKDIENADSSSFKTLLGYLKNNKEEWQEFFKEFLPNFNFNKSAEINNSENEKLLSNLGNDLKSKARGFNKITPYGIYLHEPRLFRALYAVLGNNAKAWEEFMKEYVGDSEANKFEFAPVNLSKVEKRRAEDRVLKNSASRVKALIRLVESKEGSGGVITPESIYKYGRKYGINIYGMLSGILGSDEQKWKRYFRKFIPEYKGRFSYGSVNKGVIDNELNQQNGLKNLGNNLKSLIDSKGPGSITTKSIYKYAPGLFQRLEVLLGHSSEKWSTFFKEHVGSAYAGRFYYISFSRDQVEQEKKISTLNNLLGVRFLNATTNIQENLSVSKLKETDKSLYYQIYGALGENQILWKQFAKKATGKDLNIKFDFDNAVSEKTQEEQIDDSDFEHLSDEIEKIQLDIADMAVPNVLTPQFFYENFPKEYKKLNLEIKNREEKWKEFIDIYFPEYKNRFLWRPVVESKSEDEEKVEDDESITEEIDYAADLDDADRIILDTYSSELKNKISDELTNSGEGNLYIKSILEEDQALNKNIEDLIGDDPNTKIKFLGDVLDSTILNQEQKQKIKISDPNEEKTVEQKDLMTFLNFQVENLLSSLLQEEESISLQDVYDRDPSLFNTLEKNLSNQGIKTRDYFYKFQKKYFEKINFGEVEKDEHLEDSLKDKNRDIFSEKMSQDISDEKSKTKEAFKDILMPERADQSEDDKPEKIKESKKNEIKENLTEESNENPDGNPEEKENKPENDFTKVDNEFVEQDEETAETNEKEEEKVEDIGSQEEKNIVEEDASEKSNETKEPEEIDKSEKPDGSDEEVELDKDEESRKPEDADKSEEPEEIEKVDQPDKPEEEGLNTEGKEVISEQKAEKELDVSEEPKDFENEYIDIQEDKKTDQILSKDLDEEDKNLNIEEETVIDKKDFEGQVQDIALEDQDDKNEAISHPMEEKTIAEEDSYTEISLNDEGVIEEWQEDGAEQSDIPSYEEKEVKIDRTQDQINPPILDSLSEDSDEEEKVDQVQETDKSLFSRQESNFEEKQVLKSEEEIHEEIEDSNEVSRRPEWEDLSGEVVFKPVEENVLPEKAYDVAESKEIEEDKQVVQLDDKKEAFEEVREEIKEIEMPEKLEEKPKEPEKSNFTPMQNNEIEVQEDKSNVEVSNNDAIKEKLSEITKKIENKYTENENDAVRDTDNKKEQERSKDTKLEAYESINQISEITEKIDKNEEILERSDKREEDFLNEEKKRVDQDRIEEKESENIDQELKSTDEEEVLEKIEEVVEGKVDQLMDINEQDVLDVAPQLYAKIQNIAGQDEDTVKKYLKEKIKKYQDKFFNTYITRKKDQERRIDMSEERDIKREKEEQEKALEEENKVEQDNNKESKTENILNLKIVLQECIDSIDKSYKTGVIEENIKMEEHVLSKKVKDPKNVKERFNGNVKKLLNMGVTISEFSAITANYSEYMGNAYIDAGIQMYYEFKEMPGEKHLWRFSIESIGLTE